MMLYTLSRPRDHGRMPASSVAPLREPPLLILGLPPVCWTRRLHTAPAKRHSPTIQSISCTLSPYSPCTLPPRKASVVTRGVWTCRKDTNRRKGRCLFLQINTAGPEFIPFLAKKKTPETDVLELERLSRGGSPCQSLLEHRRWIDASRI